MKLNIIQIKLEANVSKSEGIEKPKFLNQISAPLYSKPYDGGMPEDASMNIELGKIVIPPNLPDTVCKPRIVNITFGPLYKIIKPDLSIL